EHAESAGHAARPEPSLNPFPASARSRTGEQTREGIMQRSSSRLVAWVTAVLAIAVFAAVPAAAAPDNSYSVHPLASNVPGAAAHLDPNLVNGWGLTAGPTTPWWVSDNGTQKSTLYNAQGTPQALVVKVPGGPTGTVFWSFAARAFFVFSTEGGQIRGWHPSQGTDALDELHGQGLGFVDVYGLSGNLLTRVAQHGQLNAPWGLAWAPADFGRFSGDLLVGNFGDGQINAYEELPNGQFVHRGELR